MATNFSLEKLILFDSDILPILIEMSLNFDDVCSCHSVDNDFLQLGQLCCPLVQG